MTLPDFSAHSESLPPPIILDELRLGSRRLHVVRDDLLPAGTKQRAILPLLQKLADRRVGQVVYASPFCGFAQVALAYGARQKGLGCVIYAERDPALPGFAPHAFTELARSWGATIRLAESLAEAEDGAAAEAAKLPRAWKVPLGFRCEEFQVYFENALAGAVAEIRDRLGCFPRRVWLPVGSGTLARAFRAAAPAATELHCVDVRVLKESDERLTGLAALPGVHLYRTPETFPEPARVRPPVPSNLHYDAKLWAWLAEQAQDGDLWWNVAR